MMGSASVIPLEAKRHKIVSGGDVCRTAAPSCEVEPFWIGTHQSLFCQMRSWDWGWQPWVWRTDRRQNGIPQTHRTDTRPQGCDFCRGKTLTCIVSGWLSYQSLSEHRSLNVQVLLSNWALQFIRQVINSFYRLLTIPRCTGKLCAHVPIGDYNVTMTDGNDQNYE